MKIGNMFTKIQSSPSYLNLLGLNFRNIFPIGMFRFIIVTWLYHFSKKDTKIIDTLISKAKKTCEDKKRRQRAPV